jgi:stearoyl-CoA desaturase (Delta-9 desaturase)
MAQLSRKFFNDLSPKLSLTFLRLQHVFPWDYKTAELGNYRMNVTTAFIDFFAKIGWAYDLKTVSEEIIQKRVERTGDGSHESQSHTWGWGDKDQDQEEVKLANIINKKED